MEAREQVRWMRETRETREPTKMRADLVEANYQSARGFSGFVERRTLTRSPGLPRGRLRTDDAVTRRRRQSHGERRHQPAMDQIRRRKDGGAKHALGSNGSID
jgi:hypothetical protein